jgi:tetratricopeptide (TPR) repeat protein
MQVDIVSAFDDLQQLREDWISVYAADPESNYFMSWEWMSRWLAERSNWYVLAARASPDEKRWIAFLPVQLRIDFEPGEGLFNAVHMGGMPFSVYTGARSLPEYSDEAMAAFGASLQTFNWRRFNLDEIYLSEKRLAALTGSFPRSEFTPAKIVRGSHITDIGEDIDHDVYVYVKLPENFEDLLNNNFGSKTRYNARRSLRELDAGEGGLCVTHTTAETFEQNLEMFYEMWGAQWGPRQPEYAAGMIRNCRQMLRGCFDDGTLFVPVLWHDGKPVAFEVMYLDHKKKTLICFLGTRDLTLKRPAPGFLLHCYCLRWAIEYGFKIYDLGTGDYSYKFSFGADQHIVERRRVMTVSGRNIGDRLDPRTLDMACGRVATLAGKGDLENAVLACRQILDADANHARANAMLKNLEAALLRPLAEGDIEDLVRAAAADHRAGNLDRAETAYRRVIQAAPDHFACLHQLALLLLQKGKLDAASAYISRAIASRPDDAAAHCTFGNIRVSLKDEEGALEGYTKAIALEPSYASAFNNRGNVLMRMGRFKEAIGDYSRALEIAPDHAQASRNRAAAMAQMGALERV